jgi:hypothetical protein
MPLNGGLPPPSISSYYINGLANISIFHLSCMSNVLMWVSLGFCIGIWVDVFANLSRAEFLCYDASKALQKTIVFA